MSGFTFKVSVTLTSNDGVYGSPPLVLVERSAIIAHGSDLTSDDGLDLIGGDLAAVLADAVGEAHAQLVKLGSTLRAPEETT